METDPLDRAAGDGGGWPSGDVGASSAAQPGYRVVPSNEAAEQALLGAMLVNNAALDRVIDFLDAQHFYFPAHARIFDACRSLREQGRIADPLTLKGVFEQDGDLAHVGGADYLARLAAGAVGTAIAGDYGRVIVDLAVRRQLIGVGEEIVEDAYRQELASPADEQIRTAEEKLYRLAVSGDSHGGFRAFDGIVNEALASATRAINRDTHLTGVTTGLRELNTMLGGLQPSDLIILAGRPSMGKTALATNIAFNAARACHEKQGREGAVVGFFSLEMSAEQLATRILSDQARIPSEKIRKGEIRTGDLAELAEAAQLVSRIPMFVDDTAGLTVNQLRTRAMRLKRQHDLGLIVVDYLQLMQGGAKQRSESRVLEISEITRGLKLVAKDLDIPVMALSQLSRGPEQREDKRPQLADLRESGSIEQDADVVMFVYRDAYYLSKREPSLGTPEHVAWQEEMDKVHNVAEIIVGKQRHGPTGTRRLHFQGEFTRFSDLEERPGFEP